MANLWRSPIYRFSASGKNITIDVTSSISPGLGPSEIVTEIIVPLFLERRVRRILDFGAGALRNTLPLLAAGFEVYAVEYENAFARPAAQSALSQAREFSNFHALVWPHDFLENGTKFDAALLCYVLQTMPVPNERTRVLRALRNKMKEDSYLLYMSRFHQIRYISKKQRVSDGYFMWPKREEHSFYREFETAETHELLANHGFRHIRSLSRRGTDQMFLYGKGSATFA